MLYAGPWRKTPPPDPEVIGMLEKLLNAARSGHVRSVVVVMVDPVHEVETAAGGGMSPSDRMSLLGGISTIKHDLMHFGEYETPA
jgi:hypothetical protein